MSEKIEIKGVIVFDLNNNCHRFIDYLDDVDFNDGLYTSDFNNFVFVRNYTINHDIAEPIDTVSQHIKTLDEKEKTLKNEYELELEKIKISRDNLLAIEEQK